MTIPHNMIHSNNEVYDEDTIKKVDSLSIHIGNSKDTEKQITNQPNKKSNLILSRTVRRFIFIILLLISVMVNMDHGTIPAATSEIKKSLNEGDDVLGLFGSLVFLGNIIGIYLIIIRFFVFLFSYQLD